MALATVLAPARNEEAATQPDRGTSLRRRTQYWPQEKGVGSGVRAPVDGNGRDVPHPPVRTRAVATSASTRRPKLGPVECRRETPAARPTVSVEPLRLTRRGVIASWLVGCLTLGVIAFGLVQGASPAAPARAGTTVVTVMPGESLWTVAQQVNPAVDPRVTVDAVQDLNGLESASVKSGTQLMVPVFARGG